MMKKFLVILSALVIITSALRSQDAYFSQYYSSPLYLSPSMAGAAEESRMIINYRNQWPALQNTFTNYALSLDHFLPDFNSGIGVILIRDQEAGVYNNTNAGIIYNYSIKVNRDLRIRPGLKAGYFLRNIDYTKIEFADQITREAFSTIETLQNENINYYDFSASFLAHSSFYWFGFTSDHLLALNQKFADDPLYPALKISVHGGAQLDLFKSVLSKRDRTFSVSFLYKKQAKFQQLDLGAYYEEEPFRIGMFFRGVPVIKENKGLNAIVLMAGYTYRQISINYSYDITTSQLLASTGGAHELSIAYKFKMSWTGRSNKIGAVPCPTF